MEAACCSQIAPVKRFEPALEVDGFAVDVVWPVCEARFKPGLEFRGCAVDVVWKEVVPKVSWPVVVPEVEEQVVFCLALEVVVVSAVGTLDRFADGDGMPLGDVDVWVRGVAAFAVAAHQSSLALIAVLRVVLEVGARDLLIA